MEEKETAQQVPAEEAPKKEEATEQEPKKKEESHKHAKHDEALKAAQKALDEQKEAHLRVLAEYDNFRKRSQKEKDALYTDARADTVAKFLPVFDNLERALNQECQDAAYKKGVEMTMNGLRDVMRDLGVTEFGEVGDSVDPQCHNAVMHTEDPELGENVISQVFAKGFRIGEKVIRFAMVQVAN